MLIHNAQVTGSMHLNGMDMSSITGSLSERTFNLYSASINEFTGSADSRLDSLETTSGSLLTASGSFSTRVTSLESFSSSLDATFATDAQLSGVSESLASRLTSDESNITNNSSSFASRLTTDESNISSLQTASGSFSTRVSSNESNITSLQTASGSFSTRTTNLETASGSFSTRTTNLETASGSFSTRVTNAEGNITSLNLKTGSLATTGSNTFNGSQTITGSLFVTENLTVLGSSSISYVSQSTLNIGTNLITVNAQNPTTRFGGLAVIDSGSAPQVSGSWLFDSIQNRWIMIHEQTGGVVTSSIALMGPETYDNLGNETQITQNRIIKGTAGASGEHVGDSQISDDGTTVSIPGKLVVTGSFQAASVYASSLTGSINGSYLDNGSVQNAKLANSSITVTAGTGLSGGGSVSLGSSITLTNAGVTSNVAGTGISVSGATGAVTITNTAPDQTVTLTNGSNITITGTYPNFTLTNGITNNNQLTNGAGYITGITSGMVTTALGYTPVTNARTLTINGTAYDLSADRSWTIAAGVTSVNAGTGISVNSSTDAVTVTNTGVTSLTAGSGISVSASTGGITVTNTITNNNQLTNGAGYITSAALAPYLPLAGGILSGILYSTYNTATGIGNNSFNVAKTILGNIHIQNGAGTSGNNYQAAITFQGGTSSEAQAGIYVSNNNSSGTAMGFATTDSYATGPQLFMTATNTGVVNFPRARPTYAGNTIIDAANYSSYAIPISGGINMTGNYGLNDSKLYLRTNGDNNHFLWNADDDYEEIRAYGGTGFRVRSSGTEDLLLVYGASNGAYTYSPYSLRAPIFYDYNDTAYYADFNSTGTSINIAGSINVATYNKAGLLVNSSGASSSGAAFAIQQVTSEGWTGIFVDYEPYTGWGLYHDNPNNYFLITSEGSTGNFGSHTVPSRSSGNRTAYVKHRFDQNNGEIYAGGLIYSYASSRAPIFYDSDNTGYYLDPASTSNLNSVSIATLNGYTLNADNYLGRYGNSYYQVQTWLQFNGSHGIYWPSYYGAHLYPNNYNTHTQFRLDGSKNSYGGIVDSYSGVTGIMYDSGGNGGVYREANGRWYFYYHLGNDCMGIGTSSTNSGYSLYLNKGVYAQSRIDATIFYDANDTGYYVDPASTSNLNALQTAGQAVIGGNFSNNAYNSVGSTRLMFGGGDSDAQSNYYIGTNLNNYGGNYTKLDLRWHTGIRMGAQPGYGGIRIFNNEDLDSRIASFGETDAHVRVDNILFVFGSARSPIFYDYNDTGYYLDPTSTTSIRTVGSWRSDSSSWDGEFSGKMQYHSNHWYIQAADLLIYRNSGGSNVFTVNQSGVAQASADFRAPIFYDSNDTSYYVNPNGTARLSYVAANAGIRIDGNEDLYLDYNYGCSVVGVYASTRYQGVYSMGNSYKLARDGTTTGNLYGIAWSHPNAGGIAGNLADHGMLILQNGGFQGAWGGGSLRTPSDVRGTLFYDWNNTGYYCDPNSTSNLLTVQCNDWYYINGALGLYWNSYSRGFASPEQAGNSYGTVTTVGSGRNGWHGWGIGSRHVFMSTTGDNVGVHDNSRGWIWYWNGSSFNIDHGFTPRAGSARSPIFYDNNDTGYYGDFNSTSRMNRINLDYLYSYDWVYAQGDVIAYYSDERLKTKTGNIENALDKIKQLNGFYYVNNDLAKSFGYKEEKIQVGLSAQDVQKVLPEVVTLAPFDTEFDEDNKAIGSKSGENYLTVNYDKLVPLLIEAIKEQQKQIDELKAKLS